MRKKLFLAIAEHITQNCKDIKHIDLWNEHIAELQATTAFPLPAVFVEFEPFDYTQLGNHAVGANVTIRMHIVTKATPKVAGTKDKRMMQALAFFDTIDSVNCAMATLRGQGFASFMHTSSATNHNHAEMIESIERYTTRVADLTTAKLTTPLTKKTDLQIINETFG